MLRDLRQVLTGAWIRTVAGLHDMGEVIAVLVGDPDGGSLTDKDGANDVWVSSQDASHSTPTGKVTSRLFFPLNALFRLPRSGDAGIALRGAETDGPGKSMLLHGDGGGPNNGQVPDWLDENNCGLSIDKETLHFETKGENADIVAETADGRTVQLQSGDTTLTVKSGGVIEAAVAGGVKLTLNPEGPVVVDAGTGGKITMTPGGSLTIDAAPGQSIVLNGGSLAVARATDPVNGTAGPYGVVGQIVSGNSKIQG